VDSGWNAEETNRLERTPNIHKQIVAFKSRGFPDQMRPSAADSALTTSMDLVENTGSTARDYCMLERNILTHIRLALLLSILSSSLLLDARLVPQTGNRKATSGTIPLASIEFAAAMTCIAAGLWEYYNGYRDLRIARAFMAVKCV